MECHFCAAIPARVPAKHPIFFWPGTPGGARRSPPARPQKNIISFGQAPRAARTDLRPRARKNTPETSGRTSDFGHAESDGYKGGGGSDFGQSRPEGYKGGSDFGHPVPGKSLSTHFARRFFTFW